MIRLKSVKGVVKRQNQRPTGILRAIIQVTMSLDPTLANQLTDGLQLTHQLARSSSLSNLRHPLKESRSKSQLTSKQCLWVHLHYRPCMAVLEYLGQLIQFQRMLHHSMAVQEWREAVQRPRTTLLEAVAELLQVRCCSKMIKLSVKDKLLMINYLYPLDLSTIQINKLSCSSNRHHSKKE